MIGYQLFKRARKIFAEMTGGKQPTYVAIKPDLDSIETLIELAEIIQLPSSMMVAENELHATVCYSRTPIADPTKTVQGWLPIHAKGDEFTVFKTRDQGKNCLVLKLSSVPLRGLHVLLKKGYGASHDFPTFEAHVTLCYDTPDYVIKNAESIADPNVNLLFTKFEVKPLEID